MSHPATPPMTTRSCREANGWGCHAPANLDEPVERNRLAKCYSCGEDVCISFSCSDLVRYVHARGQQVRMCWTCILEREPDGEVQVRYDEALIAAYATLTGNGTPTGRVHAIHRPRSFEIVTPDVAVCGVTARHALPVGWSVFAERSRCRKCAKVVENLDLALRLQ